MKKIYFLLVALVVTFLSFGQDLTITGAFDGPLPGGTPKLVEIYVVNDIADLSTYGFGSANNGGGTDGQEITFAGSATAGDFIYVGFEGSGTSENLGAINAYFGITADYIDSAAGINGDDALEIFNNGTVIDVFGTIDCDPNANNSTCPEWEHTDGWVYRIDGTGPEGSTFTLTNWTYSGINMVDGCTDNATCASVFPIGTYSPTINTDPTISITAPFNMQAFDSGTSSIDVAFTVANAPGATVNVTVITNGGSPVTTNAITSPFTISPTADGDTYTVTVDLVDGGVLDSDTVGFNIAFPCNLQVGTITSTCDSVTPATTDTYNLTIAYTGGTGTTYTIDTGGVGTVGGDDPSSIETGVITISDITEGTDFTITFTGDAANSSCDFTRNINSPDCDPQLVLPLYEGFDYTVASNLIASANWENISNSSDEVVIGGPGGLSFTNLAGSAQTGNHVSFDGVGSDPAIQFTAVTSGALYASFLINITSNDAATAPGYFAVLGDFDARLWTVPGASAGEYQLGISNVNSPPTGAALDTTVLTTNSTVLVVLNYDLATGTMNLWVNPSDSTFGGAAPAASATDTDPSSATSLNQFVIRQDTTSETPFFLFDELRIGTSYADVTPATLSNDEFSTASFRIYPNPTNLGYVNIASSQSDAMTAQIFDILGKQVKTEGLSNNRLNVSNLNTGIYILKITQNNNTVTKKLVIR